MLALLLAPGCSDDEQKKDAAVSTDSKVSEDLEVVDQKAGKDQKAGGDAKVSPDAPASTALEGTWLGPCEKDSEGDDRLVTLTFSGKTHVHSTISHETKTLTCSPKAVTMMRNIRSTFKVGAASSSVAGAWDLDHSIVSISYKPLTTAAAAYLNGKSYCGKTDWKQNVEKVFTTTPCEPGRPTAGGTVLDIFKISGGGKTLQIGGGSVVTRPTKLAPAKYIKK